jgi:hypothetical protein
MDTQQAIQQLVAQDAVEDQQLALGPLGIAHAGAGRSCMRQQPFGMVYVFWQLCQGLHCSLWRWVSAGNAATARQLEDEGACTSRDAGKKAQPPKGWKASCLP